MIHTRKAVAAAAAIQAASRHDVLRTLVEDPTGKQNMVKIDGDYEAEAKGDALARGQLGESGQGQGHHTGGLMVGKTTGLSWNDKGQKPTGFIGYRDVSSRKPDGSYDFRSMTVFDTLHPERNLGVIHVSDNFGTWVPVHLDDPELPDWPELPEDEKTIEAFLEGLQGCLNLGQLIEIFVKKINYLKKKIGKDKEKGITNGELRAIWLPPSGTTEKIVVAATDEGIPGVRREVHRVRLNMILPEPHLQVLYGNKWTTEGKGKAKGQIVLRNDVSFLPVFMAELDRLRKEYAKRYELVRPYEMGLIERAKDEEGGSFPEIVNVGGMELELEIQPDSEYDQPEDTAKKLATGEYVKKAVPRVQGSWELQDAKQPQAV
jgi:hypothetical protein